MKRWVLTSVFAFLTEMQAHGFQDPAAGSVSASTVSLPSGPGSFSGLGHAGEVSVFSGQYTYSYPIDLPSGQAGFGPNLALGYDGGLGNGVVGLGWGFTAPHIERTTRLGPPSYGADDELRLTGIGGGGRLIKVDCGSWSGEYRLEGHGQAVRIVASDSSSSPERFTVQSPDGSSYVLERMIFEPASGETFAWYVTEIHSVGNVDSQTITFSYRDAGSVSPESSVGHALLDSIEWGPRPADGPEAGQPAFRVEVEYSPRPDPVDSYSAGFRQILRHRLQTIVVRSFGGVRKTFTFEYEPEFPLSRLSSIAVSGADFDPIALPPVRFSYGSEALPFMEPDVDVGGWNLAERGVVLQDVDDDGLVDLARYEAGSRAWRKNNGGSFGPELPLRGGAETDLASVRLLDVDADMRADLVYQVDDTWRVYRMTMADAEDDGDADDACVEGVATWTFAGEWPGTFMLPVDDGSQAFADFNGDGMSDVLEAVADHTSIRWSTPTGMESPFARPPVSLVDGVIAPGDPGLQFLDMQGDGLADAVRMTDGWIKVYPGRGDGTFETNGIRYCYPWNWSGDAGPTLSGSGHCRMFDADFIDFENIRIVDLDRDGMQDLVRVSAGYVVWYPGYWYADAADGSLPFGSPHFLPRPEGADHDDVVTFADLNGNGSSDVVWSSQFGLSYLELVGSASRAMLTRIDNGLGMTTDIAYTSTALSQVAACESGNSWTRAFPVNMVVPSTIRTQISGEPERRSITIVRDGFWDPDERRFGGFLEGTSIAEALPFDYLDEHDLVTTVEYERGEGVNRVLRGVPRLTTRRNGAGAVFDEVLVVHDTIAVEGLACGDPLLRSVVVEKQLTTFSELTCTPRFVLRAFEHDGWGNIVREINYGEVAEDESDLPNEIDHEDEVVTNTRYLSNWDDWVLFKPCETLVESVDGLALERDIVAYDSDSAPTLGCVGTAGDGRPRHQWAWLAEESRWVSRSETAYDEVGNVTSSESDGIRRVTEWDADAMFMAYEYVLDGDSASWMESEITVWQKTLGIPLELRDAADRVSRIEVDGLGRVVASFGGTGSDVHQLTSVEYNVDGPGPIPRIRTTELKEAVPDSESVVVLDASGQERYSAVREAEAAWIIQGHRVLDERGLTVERLRPYVHSSASLPTGAPPVDVAREVVAYDPLGRAVQQFLPQVARYPSDGPQDPAMRAVTYAPFVTTTTSTEMAAVVSVTDGRGRIIRSYRDVGQREEVLGRWDPAGRLVEWVRDPLGASLAHQYVYDSLGRLVSADDPESGTRELTWTDDDRLESVTNAAGDLVEFQYDFAGRLSKRHGLSADDDYDETWDFVYDLWEGSASTSFSPGQLVAVIGPDDSPTAPGERIYYDSFGRVTEQFRTIVGHDNIASSLTNYFNYDISGALLERRVQDGSGEQLRVAYEYDRAGRMRWLGGSTGGSEIQMLWEAVALSPAGDILREHFGNGVVTTSAYDALGQMVSMTSRDTDVAAAAWDDEDGIDPVAALGLEAAFAGSLETRYAIGIERSGAGLVRRVTDGAPISGKLSRDGLFTYDQGGRLIGARVAYGTASEVQFEYGYDKLQNMVKRNQVSPTPAVTSFISGLYTYGEGTASPRQLTSIGLDHEFEYDAAGRMKRQRDGAAHLDMAFDAFDRLRSVRQSTGLTVARYKYDADGVRSASQSNSGAIERFFDTGLTQRDPDGVGPLDGSVELRVAVGRSTVKLEHSESQDVITYLLRGFGPGPSVIMDDDGSLLEERTFEPYGAELEAYTPTSTGTFFNAWLESIGANGMPIDADTRWSDHGARWLVTQTGTWLSVDPASRGPDSFGLLTTPYAYAAANPLLFWDPDGREPTAEQMAKVKAEVTALAGTMHLQYSADPSDGTNCISALNATLLDDMGAWPDQLDLNTPSWSEFGGPDKSKFGYVASNPSGEHAAFPPQANVDRLAEYAREKTGRDIVGLYWTEKQYPGLAAQLLGRNETIGVQVIISVRPAVSGREVGDIVDSGKRKPIYHYISARGLKSSPGVVLLRDTYNHQRALDNGQTQSNLKFLSLIALPQLQSYFTNGGRQDHLAFKRHDLFPAGTVNNGNGDVQFYWIGDRSVLEDAMKGAGAP